MQFGITAHRRSEPGRRAEAWRRRAEAAATTGRRRTESPRPAGTAALAHGLVREIEDHIEFAGGRRRRICKRDHQFSAFCARGIAASAAEVNTVVHVANLARSAAPVWRERVDLIRLAVVEEELRVELVRGLLSVEEADLGVDVDRSPRVPAGVDRSEPRRASPIRRLGATQVLLSHRSLLR